MQRHIVYLQVLLILAVASTIVAQRPPEIGIIGLKDWTEDEELKNPYGVGIYLFQPLSDKVKLTIEYDYLTSRIEDRIYLYDYYYPPSGGSVPSKVIRRNNLFSYQIGLRHLISRLGSTSLEFGGGLCLVHADAKTRVVDTGERWFMADSYKWGLVLDIGLFVADLKDLPLTMRFGFRHRFLGESAAVTCVGASMSSDPITTTEISWGFGYQFGR